MRSDSVERYLEQVADILGSMGGVFEEGPVIRLGEDGVAGFLSAGLAFATGHRLYVDLDVTFGSEFPEWRRYSFHFVEPSGTCVFRYDNSFHYPDLPFFPEHRHVGEQVQGHPQPSIRDILREIAGHER